MVSASMPSDPLSQPSPSRIVLIRIIRPYATLRRLAADDFHVFCPPSRNRFSTNTLSSASTCGATVLSLKFPVEETKGSISDSTPGHQIGICRAQKVSHSTTNTRASAPTESEGANLANIAVYEERETLELRRESEDETCDDENAVPRQGSDPVVLGIKLGCHRHQPLGKSNPR